MRVLWIYSPRIQISTYLLGRNNHRRHIRFHSSKCYRVSNLRKAKQLMNYVNVKYQDGKTKKVQVVDRTKELIRTSVGTFYSDTGRWIVNDSMILVGDFNDTKG